MGAAVTAAAKQHKLAKAAVYLPDSSAPLTVSMLQLHSKEVLLYEHLFFDPAGVYLPPTS